MRTLVGAKTDQPSISLEPVHNTIYAINNRTQQMNTMSWL